MAPRDVPAVGGSTSRCVAASVSGSCGPLPTFATMALPGVMVEVPNPRDTFGELGVELLEERPPQPPTPSCSCFANAGGAQDPWPDLHSARR